MGGAPARLDTRPRETYRERLFFASELASKLLPLWVVVLSASSSETASKWRQKLENAVAQDKEVNG